MTKLTTSLLLFTFCFFFFTTFAFASSHCQPIYGGGVTDKKVCLTPTPPTTTKGGLPVAPAPNLQTTPATGPEMIGLLALISSAIAGIFLRRKTTK